MSEQAKMMVCPTAGECPAHADRSCAAGFAHADPITGTVEYRADGPVVCIPMRTPREWIGKRVTVTLVQE